MTDEEKYWILANQAAKKLGWHPETIFTQWAWETAHFASANLRNNQNIAGQTWTPGCGHPKGTPRPKSEGGWYIKYPDASSGYVEFIQKNHRYDGVKKEKTVEAQIEAIARSGWAADPRYASGLISLHHNNLKKGIYNLPKEKEPQNPYPGHVMKLTHPYTQGDLVRRIQAALGMPRREQDGIYGPETVSYVRAFQKDHSLFADGQMGPITWKKLFD